MTRSSSTKEDSDTMLDIAVHMTGRARSPPWSSMFFTFARVVGNRKTGAFSVFYADPRKKGESIKKKGKRGGE